MQDSLNIITDTLTLLNSEYVTIPFSQTVSRMENLYGLITVAIFMSVIAFLRLTDTALFRSIITGIFKYRNAENLLGTGFATLGQRLLLLTLSFGMIAIFLTQITSNAFFNVDTIVIFLLLFVAHFATIGIYQYLGWTFNNLHIAKVSSMSLWLSNISLGFITSPLILSLFFVRPEWHSTLIKFIICVALFLLIVRIFRWIRILFDNRVFILFMILYLCALEIAPILLLIKVVLK